MLIRLGRLGSNGVMNRPWYLGLKADGYDPMLWLDYENNRYLYNDPISLTRIFNTGNYAYFDRVNDYVQGPEVDYNTTNLSCFVWVNGTTTGVTEYFFGQYDTGASKRAWVIEENSSNRTSIILSKDGTYSSTTSKSYLLSTSVRDGSLHLLGFTWDSGTLKLYLDGIEQTVVKSYDATFTSINDTTQAVSLGCAFNSGAIFGPTEGDLPSCYMFNETLTDAQCLELYNTGAVVGADMVLKYDLTGANVKNVPDGVEDLSGNGNHGTAYGDYTFTRTTTGTITDADGLVYELPINYPRIQGAKYDTIDGRVVLTRKGSGYLNEEQRTKLLVYPNDLSKSNWTKAGLTNTGTMTTAPDGSTVPVWAIGTTGYFYQAYSAVSGTTYAPTIYIKANKECTVGFRAGGSSSGAVDINLTTEWQRFEVVGTATSTGNLNFILDNRSSSGYGVSDLELAVWCAETEAGAFATSPLPYRGGSTATRTADGLSYDITDIMAGKDEGTIVLKINSPMMDLSLSRYIFSLSDGTSDNQISLYKSSTSLYLRSYLGGSGDAAITVTELPNSDEDHIFVITWAENDFRLYIDGVLVGYDTECTTFYTALTKLYVGCGYAGSSQFTGLFKVVGLYGNSSSDGACKRLSGVHQMPITTLGTPATVVGDSITYGSFLCKAYFYWLGFALDGRLYYPQTVNRGTTSAYGGNCGVSGETSAQIAARASTFNTHNGVYILLMGANDGTSVTAETQQANFETIFTELSGAEKIYVIPFAPTLTVYNSSTLQTRNATNLAWLRGDATSTYKNLEVLPDSVWNDIALHDGAGGIGDDSYDGTHPNNYGAYKLGTNIANVLSLNIVSGDAFDWTSGFTNIYPADFSGTSGTVDSDFTGVVATGLALIADNMTGLTGVASKGTLNGSDSQIFTITGTSGATAPSIVLRENINHAYSVDSGLLMVGNVKITASDGVSAPVGLTSFGAESAYGKHNFASRYSPESEGGLPFVIDGIFINAPETQGTTLTTWTSDIAFRLMVSTTVDVRIEISDIRVFDMNNEGL